MNKESAIAFLEYTAEGKIDEAYAEFVALDFIHHNIWFPGDRESLKQGMKGSHENFPDKKIRIKQVVEENDIVVTFSHLSMNPIDRSGFALMHIFRFKDGKIVELWDMGQQIPPISPNENGMF